MRRRHFFSASLLAAVLPGTCSPEADLMGRMLTLSGVDAVAPFGGKFELGINPATMNDTDPPDPPGGGGGSET